jgi:hypothetical protein
MQADCVDDESADCRRNPPYRNVQWLHINPRAKQEGVHQGNRAKGDKDVFTKEQADVCLQVSW